MDITKFEFEGRKVRVVTDETGQLWWVAKDVCSAIDLSDVSMSMQALEDDEKLIQTFLVSGQQRQIWTVNEPGLYTLIIRSNKPEAKKFKRWITHEVLPSIRRTGVYVAPVTMPDLLTDSIDPAALKPNQRLKAWDLAYRFAQLDEEGLQRMYRHYATICNTVSMQAPEDDLPDPGRDFAAFIRERCVIDANASEKATRLYNEYKRWWAKQAQAGRILSQKGFGMRLRKRFRAYKHGVYYYEGIRIRKPGE